jgi:hypothetical protein
MYQYEKQGFLVSKDLLIPSISAESTFKLVKDTIVFIQVAKFVSQMVMNVDGFDRFAFHIDIPQFQC